MGGGGERLVPEHLFRLIPVNCLSFRRALILMELSLEAQTFHDHLKRMK